jgi:membrane protease YdiL (CAAX protease family)
VLILPIAAVLAVMLVVNLLNNRWREHWYMRTCLVGAAVILGIGLLDQQSWQQLGLAPSTYITGLLWAAGAVGAVLAVYLIGLALPFTRKFFLDERAGEQSGTELIRNALVVVPFGTVLLEEVAFRSVLFAMVASRYGTAWAVTVSSVVFGLWHILPSLVMHESNAGVGELLGSGMRARVLAVLTSVVGTGAAGVLFCLLRVWSGSLFAPMGLHWALNGLGFVFTWGIYRRRRARSPFTRAD